MVQFENSTRYLPRRMEQPGGISHFLPDFPQWLGIRLATRPVVRVIEFPFRGFCVFAGGNSQTITRPRLDGVIRPVIVHTEARPSCTTIPAAKRFVVKPAGSCSIALAREIAGGVSDDCPRRMGLSFHSGSRLRTNSITGSHQQN